MILLDEKEIVAYASKDSEYCQLSVDVGMWASKEQLKRVAEWLDGHGYLELKYGHPIRGVLEDEWQALKKEAGIDEKYTPCTRCGHGICECGE